MSSSLLQDGQLQTSRRITFFLFKTGVTLSPQYGHSPACLFAIFCAHLALFCKFAALTFKLLHLTFFLEQLSFKYEFLWSFVLNT